jgi:hypothetical protein
MKYCIQITPKSFVDAEDQKWWQENSPRFMGESKSISFKGDVKHSIVVPQDEAKVFDTIEEANQWLEILVTDKSSNYEIVPANI